MLHKSLLIGLSTYLHASIIRLFLIQNYLKNHKSNVMIHIIDDDKCVREGFTMLLKSADIECTSYESAEEFLKFYDLNRKELLILDMHMPGISGCDLLKILREKGLRLPVIIVTAYNDEASRKYAKNYGAIAYLHKPVDSEALLDLIKFNTGILN